MNIILYTTHCPKCTVIEKKLKAKNIPFTEVDDVETMQALGFHSLPVLKVDDEILNFQQAYMLFAWLYKPVFCVFIVVLHILF